MVGLLSQIFDSVQSADLDGDVNPDVDANDGGGNGQADTDAGSGDGGASSAQGGGDTAGDGSGQGTSGSNSLGGELAVNPTVSFHSDLGGSIETMDGSTHSWSSTEDVSATADVDAVIGLTNDYTIDSFES